MENVIKSKGTIDQEIRWFTTSVLVIFAVTVGLSIRKAFSAEFMDQTITYIAIIVASSIIPIWAYLFAPKGYLIRNKKLIILRKIGGIELDLNQLNSVEKIDDLKSFRLFGFGGIFGFYGKFKLKNHERVNYQIMSKKNVLLLSFTKNKKYLISPDDKAIFNYLKQFS